MNEILLPRPLVVRLLTLAQGNAESTVRGIVGARGGEPVGMETIDGGRDLLFDFPTEKLHAAIQSLAMRGELLYAAFETRSTAIQPQVEDLERPGVPGLLYLVVSLGTKGVLEMQGWRLVNERPETVHIGVKEID